MAYDITMIGHICKDTLYDMGDVSEALGGAVYYSSIAAARSGKQVHVITMATSEDDSLLDVIRLEGVTVTRIPSPRTTQITLRYESPDRERREVILDAQADPFQIENFHIPESRVFHLAGLFKGEIPDNFISFLAEKGEVALDVQGVLRCSENGTLIFKEWERAAELLPFIKYLKTDAAEAYILTGLHDRKEAARTLAAMGAQEVMITHNEEVLVCAEGNLYTAPFNPDNLSGRTGRGDTTFAAYLAKRLDADPEEALYHAAALCSIKMETPGPFKGNLSDVLTRMGQLGYQAKTNH